MIASLILACLSAPPELPAEPEPIAVPAPAEDASEQDQPATVPTPAEVQDAAEQGQGPVPQPEQVRDDAEAGQGAVPPPAVSSPPQPPSTTPPNPRARPSEGVHAVGSSGVTPLPPPPPPVPPSSIARGRWSGVGWLSVRLLVGGPIAGAPPARPTVISLGGGAEGGWRIRQSIALGSGFTRQPHELYREELPDVPATVSYRGYMSAWDIAFVRLYAPVRGRVDPFIDVGGGLAFFDPARDRPLLVGGTVRASAGFEAWVARNLTLGITGIYRANFVDETIGHAWQAAVDFGIHW